LPRSQVNARAAIQIFSSLLRDAFGKLDRAREVLEKLLREKNAGLVRLFDWQTRTQRRGQDAKSVDLLQTLKRRMYADKKQNEFAAEADKHRGKASEIAADSGILAALYNEDESRGAIFLEVLVKLFDVHLEQRERAEGVRDAGTACGH